MKSRPPLPVRILLTVAVFLLLFVLSTPYAPARAAPAEDTFIFLPVVMSQHWVPSPQYPTDLLDVNALLETCPQSDPNFAMFSADFQVRVDGEVVTNFPCSEPVSAMPIDQKTYELRALQSFRLAYYLDPHVPNYLPWTTKNLYNWLKGNVSGINYKTTPSGHYCCEMIDGKPFIVSYFSGGSNQYGDLGVDSVVPGLFFFAHEARHRDPDDPGHTTGCETFPIGSGVYGCDQSYDEARLGAYGIQRWLYKALGSGYLNIGIGCSPNAWITVTNMIGSANGYRSRFVTNIPEVLPLPAPPYGGPCLKP